MSSTHASTDQQQAANDARRRKRKERAAKSRTPEPKDIVSGAGQPLDVGVRRELEEQLGHDLGNVRLHTDRDAGTLTDMLGADAVAVGQDIFFREGAYAPGTSEGYRLLAHELLHTVQNPYGAGPLTAGRDLGAVSLPHEAAEQEAESTAQRLMREETAGQATGGQATAESSQAVDVEQGEVTPAWMRYATVDADRMRTENLDPAGLVERLANSVVRSLRSDPEDRSKRTRRQLARLPEGLQDDVLERLETRLLSTEHDRVLDLMEEFEQSGEAETGGLAWQGSLEAPALIPDPVEELTSEREAVQRTAEEQQAREEKPAPAPGPEKGRSNNGGAAGSTPENGGPGQGGATQQRGQQQEKEPASDNGGDASSPTATGEQPTTPASRSDAAQEQQAQQQDASSSGKSQEKAGEKSGEQKQGEEKSGEKADGSGEKGEKKDGGKDGDKAQEKTEQEGAPAESKEESAARNRPGAAESLVAGKQPKQDEKDGKGKGSPDSAGGAKELPGPSSRLEGVRNQDLEGPEEGADDDPFGSGSESEVEVGGGEKSAWDVKLQPEDFLPEKDLDVSAVPTADKVDHTAAPPAMPSFPAPPVTKADKVQAERDAEDAEDEAAEEEPEEQDEAASGESTPPVETEGGPSQLADGLGLGEALGAKPGTATNDPKSGDDPKEGPVTAQATVQEAPGKAEADKDVKEQAAKEEKGSAAGGDKASGAQEKESQKAGGTGSAQAETKGAEQQTAGAGPADKADGKDAGKADGKGADKAADNAGSGADKGVQAEDKDGPGSDSKSPSAARDTHVSGQSGTDTSSGAGDTDSSSAGTEGTSGGAPEQREETPSTGSRGTGGSTEKPTEKRSAPAASSPAKSAPASAAPTAAKSAPEPKAAPEPRASSPKSRPAPTSRGGGGGGRGGGGGAGSKSAGGAKGKKKAAKATPNLSKMSPEAGLSTASSLKPHQAVEAMGGVSSAVDRTVGDEHKELAGSPPSMQRPAGAPQTLHGKPKSDAPAQYSQDPAQKADAPKDEKAEVKGEKKPEGQIEAEKAEEPGGWDTFKMALGFGIGKVLSWVGFEVDASELAAKFAGLPTKDEALKQAQAGNAPGVDMKGAAGEKADEQGGHVDDKGQDSVDTGRDDARRNMGENQVYPDAPKEEMKGKVPGQQGGKGGKGHAGGAKTGAVPPEAASEVAEHDRGPQFRKAFSEGQKGMSKERETKEKDSRKSKEKHKSSVDKEVTSNTKSQAGEREKALKDVDGQREDWRKEQDGELKKLGTKKSDRHDKVRKDVKDKEEQTDKDVGKEKEGSDKKIKDEGTKAEEKAEKKKDDSANESGNWVTKAFDWIKEKVIEIKNAIVKVIKDARDAVIGFIKNFKETVERWINDARKAIVDAIKNFINDLIEFAKAMVRAVIELANRIRKFITSLIAAAIALVNKLARMLKQIVKDLLDALAKLLGNILNILMKALQDVIKAVVAAVKTVLEYASKILGALGEFMLIAVDFLSDPGGWLSGAKNSAVDGAKNHLFREVKAAVKAWFQSKIEEIIGVPKAILDKLLKGGWTLERIVKETWDAIVPQLPFIIGEIVITKVVAKLIPGAGWVMAVIDAIRTAIGALGEILKAMGAVISWLKAVRQGGAGILFAKAVAAGIVALLELAYEALLSGIGKYVSKIGRRLKAIAAKLGGKKDKPGGGKSGGADGSDGKGGKRKEREEDPDAAKGDAPPHTAGAPGARPVGTKPRPDGKSGSKPDGKPGGKADGKPGAKPDGKPSAKPGTKSDGKPGSKPDGKPGLDKPGQKGPGKDGDKDRDGGKDEAPGKPKPRPDKDADGKPSTSKDKDGKPKSKDDDKPDTRPTPAPKPKPKPESKPKPKDDPDAKPKPKDDDKDGSGKPKDDKGDKGSTKPKDDDKSPGKDKNPDEDGKPKSKDDKDGDGKKPKGKDDKDGDRTKPKPGKEVPGKRRPKPDKKGPGKSKPRPDKRGPGKPKSKADKDRRKKDEESDAEKSKRLALIIARIRPIIKRRTKHGMPDADVRTMLASMRRHYRLKRLYGVGAPKIELHAGLSPGQRFEELHQQQAPVQGQELDFDEQQPAEPPLPPTKLPPFKDGPEKAPSLKAHHIKKSTPRGTETFERPKASPKGWDMVSPHHNANGDWVRMHLLPAPLGGEATTSNLVPARHSQNQDAASAVEHPAAKSLGNVIRNSKWKGQRLNKMIWYDVNVSYYDDDVYPGFPNSMTITWGGYDYPSGHWQRDPATGVWSREFRPPPHKEDNSAPVANVNEDDARTIHIATGVSMYFTKRIASMTAPNRGRVKTFSNMAALTRALNKGKHLRPGELDETHTGGSHKNRLEALMQLRRAKRKGRLTF
ncbi:DUF4157 domain-containing protein [Streptomyces bathyalis]|uniref:DUF4157 domain-containing protein n=1 Tax=Streptomyces bathyalis TaxID=2710756 RepID=A0A7T1T8G6_9ACTN|nr:DUF4157 domain-containing protein [Streptomyces bathyalis]QPP08314.1 DUF4157 domain-containing protein [Streptomyces bathyalis]